MNNIDIDFSSFGKNFQEHLSWLILTEPNFARTNI